MDIEKAFRHTKYLPDDVKNSICQLEEYFVNMAMKINDLPESREKSLAMTKLQEAKFWATDCIAKNVG